MTSRPTSSTTTGYTWLAQPVTFQVAAAPTPTPDGTLKLETQHPIAGQPLTFSYTTKTPAALNWVGVYNDPSDGPTGQSYNAPSTAYTYTGANTSGTVTVSGPGSHPGTTSRRTSSTTTATPGSRSP